MIWILLIKLIKIILVDSEYKFYPKWFYYHDRVSVLGEFFELVDFLDFVLAVGD